MQKSLHNRVLKLAHDVPSLRKHLIPLLREAKGNPNVDKIYQALSKLNDEVGDSYDTMARLQTSVENLRSKSDDNKFNSTFKKLKPLLEKAIVEAKKALPLMTGKFAEYEWNLKNYIEASEHALRDYEKTDANKWAGAREKVQLANTINSMIYTLHGLVSILKHD